MQPVVFFGSAGLVVAFVLVGVLATEQAASGFEALRTQVVDLFGWYYALSVTGFLLFALWLMLGPYAHLRLGPDDSRPDFGLYSWFAMLFSAGMGTGIVFWAVAEPLYHYTEPLLGAANTDQAARDAMRYTFFHWGLHPWAIYILFATAIAYYHYRHDLPLAPRSILAPFLGQRLHGGTGHVVDILCTVGTLLGVSTSLGLGAMQINQGLGSFTPVKSSTMVQVILIAVITLVATISVVLGVQAGIRRLSRLNLSLAGLLMLFVFLAGPTLFILETLVGSLALYIQTLPEMSLFVNFTSEDDWQARWTFFYWGWWISWSPFVGVFVARISRGRTLREFVFWVMLVPSLGTFVWLSVFGGAGLYMELVDGAGLAATVRQDVAVSLHALLGDLPFATVMQIFATVVIIIFFVTSSDSGSLVDDMVTSGGHPHPPRAQRVFWAVAEGAVAATLLVVGGLRAIQDASISLGFLMSFLLILICLSLVRSFRRFETARS
ncbi:MAG: BCCT family transporter [Rhodothalassiaceae bacterium]